MWTYNNQVFSDIIEEFESFVYLITRLNYIEEPNRPIYYIGKKVFFNKLKGGVKKESDWQDYYGSSKDLQEDIKKYGKHNFKREILYLCRTRGESGYLEVKEQIERDVLSEDSLYYNKNILGKYFKSPVMYNLEGDLRNYFNSENIEGNKNKKWVNNGNVNKVMSIRNAEKLVKNSNWVYGKIRKKIPVNDGIRNLYVEKEEIDNYNLGHIKKRITNGINNKLMTIEEAEIFLKNNTDWYCGFSGNNNMIWITNGVEDKKVRVNDISLFEGYYPGRSNIYIKNKVAVFKDEVYRFIDIEDVNSYIEKGWQKGTNIIIGRRFHVTDGIIQKHFGSEQERNEFLNSNSGWKKGQLYRENFNTNDKVFAIDIRTDTKVTVSKDEMKNNKYLVGIKTQKVKIKKKNKIIFKGYLEQYLINDNSIPKNIWMEALRKDGKLFRKKGKYKWINNEYLSITKLE